MTRRKSATTFLVAQPHKSARMHAHSLLEAELLDIRRSLAQLERELESNVTEIRRARREQNSEVA